jgi:hypothetical protein
MVYGSKPPIWAVNKLKDGLHNNDPDLIKEAMEGFHWKDQMVIRGLLDTPGGWMDINRMIEDPDSDWPEQVQEQVNIPDEPPEENWLDDYQVPVEDIPQDIPEPDPDEY